MGTHRRLAAALAATAAFAATAALADGPSFKGKQINYIIASNAGGGTDRAARLFGRFLAKYLPGNPKMVYRNMGAGGGKIRAANYLAIQAKPDGYTAMGTDSTPAGPTASRRKVAKFDPRDFRAVGGLNGGGSVLFVRKPALKRLTDAKAEPVIVGAISGTRTWQAMAVWGKAYLGWNLKWVPGYKGTGSLVKAIRQGEIDMFATASSRVLGSLGRDGVVAMVAQEGQGASGEETARATYPGVPVMPRLLAKAKMPDIARQGYRGWIGASQIDKWVALPPKTPEPFVAAWRAAFDRMVKDAEFLRLVKKQISTDAVFMTGDRIEAMLKDIHSVSDEAIAFARGLRQKYELSSR